jgi:phosphoesterase RecJ-like protein
MYSFDNLYEDIATYDTIMIHTHTKPDGDCICSGVALKDAIDHNFNGKKVIVLGSDPLYPFIKDSCSLSKYTDVTDETFGRALAISIDTPMDRMIYDGKRFFTAAKKIRIDHHTNDQFENKLDGCILNVASSASEIIAEFIFNKGLTLSQLGWEALYAGIMTDSGNLTFTCTTPDTHRVIGDIVEHIDAEKIYNIINSYSENTLNLQRFMMDKQVAYPNGYVVVEITADERHGFKSPASEWKLLVNNLFKDRKDIIAYAVVVVGTEIYVSMRSTDVPIDGLMRKYGGGGHPNASGCVIKTREQYNELIEDIKNRRYNPGL